MQTPCVEVRVKGVSDSSKCAVLDATCVPGTRLYTSICIVYSMCLGIGGTV